MVLAGGPDPLSCADGAGVLDAGPPPGQGAEGATCPGMPTAAVGHRSRDEPGESDPAPAKSPSVEGIDLGGLVAGDFHADADLGDDGCRGGDLPGNAHRRGGPSLP
jgi:hypothetical protein